MYRFLLVIALLFSVNFAFCETSPKQSEATEPSEAVETPNDTLTVDSTAIEEDTASIVQQEAKSGKPKEDEAYKESLGYKIGYQIGSWLIPGILMIVVTIMIARRAKKGRDQNPGL